MLKPGQSNQLEPIGFFGLNLPDKFVRAALVTELALAGYHATIADKITVRALVTAEKITGAQAVVDAHDYETAKMAEILSERDRLLCAEDYLILRHIEQTAAGIDTSLSDAQYQDWLVYRQALRDLPAQITDVDNVAWPVSP